MSQNLNIIAETIDLMRKSDKSPKILIKVARNMGDSLHATPIIHHYRKIYKNAYIAFATSRKYHNVHEFNPHIDKLVLLEGALEPQERLEIWKRFKANTTYPDITFIFPAIHPFGAVHQCNVWSLPNIADQYLHNAGITGLRPLGGKKLQVTTTDQDKQWVDNFLKINNINPNKALAVEYLSYSIQPIWGINEFAKMSDFLINNKISVISICGPHEGIIPRSIDGRGMSWRRTTELLNRVRAVIGIGSGILMLAAAAERPPKILELGVSESISMKHCGYADSIRITNPNPNDVANWMLLDIFK